MSYLRAVALIGGLAVTGGLAAQQPESRQTVQQQFDAASALDAGKDGAAALSAWETLEGRVRTNKRTHALVLVRKGNALFRQGRDDEALAALRTGLADLPTGDKTLEPDRYDALMTVGRITRSNLDYAGSTEAYGQAARLASTPDEQMSSNLGLAQVATFIDAAVATAALARVDALVAANKVAPDVQAVVEQQHALFLLNQGDANAAIVPAKAAVAHLGGLTSRTDLRDVSARATASLALLLAKKSDDARKYMAMTGAGRLNTGSFDPAVQMNVPDCGGGADLKPQDVAVIEFSIGDDGTVSSAAPIYAAGGGRVALEFARTARGWSWTPEQVKSLPPFFRYNARVELRCSTGFERPGVDQLLAADLSRWLEDKGVTLPEGGAAGDAAGLSAQRAALARAEAADPAGLQTLAALWVLSRNAVVGREETHTLATRALAIAQARGAPPAARLAIDLAARRTENAASSWHSDRALRPLLTDAAYAADPESRAAARLVVADQMGRGSSDGRRVLMQQVIDDAALRPDNRFRVGALVRLASLEQESGNAAAARTAFEKTGLDASQCAIIDAPPKFLGAGGTFPQEAMLWGFEGWTQTQFDVTADGRVVNERAIISYPPFVFTDAGRRTMAGARFAKTFRPGNELGCSANSQRVRFLMHGPR